MNDIMKNTIIACLLMLGCGFWSCTDNADDAFQATVPQQTISFDPIAGGAVMHYKMPEDKRIEAIKVRYNDVNGKEVKKLGSYLSDSIILVGFNEARTNIPIAITLIDKHGNESEPVMMSFNTANSIPVSFFDDLDITPMWDGFQLSYVVPKEATGYAHVFYLGENQFTHKRDTVLIKTILIRGGGETVNMEVKQKALKNTIIIRTEDFRGYTAMEKVYEDIDTAPTQQLKYKTDFEFEDPSNCSYEEPGKKLGIEYLFDGDTKGEKRFLGDINLEAYTFIANNAVGKHWIVDMKTPRIPAWIRIYGMLPFFNFPIYLNHVPYNKLPNEVTVYGSNDKSAWEKIAYYYDDPANLSNGTWADGCYFVGETNKSKSIEQIRLKAPVFMSIEFLKYDTPYRYLKIEVNGVFKDPRNMDTNPNKIVTFNELEIITKYQ